MKTNPGAIPRPRSRRNATATDDPRPPTLAALFRALGDETRLEILERLARAGETLCVCDLECCFDLSQPTVSHHLKVLREAGLVKCERRGTWVHCAVHPEAFGRIAVFARSLAPKSPTKQIKKGKTS